MIVHVVTLFQMSLRSACLENCQDIVHSLLEQGVPVDDADQDGVTALMVASEVGRRGCVSLLLSNGADVDKLSEHDTGALYLASDRGHTEIVQLLVEHGASLNVGRSPLVAACAAGAESTVRFLVQNGADASDYRPSHEACMYNEPGCLEILLEHGAPVESSLNFACELNHPECVRVLLRFCADVNAPLLHTACEMGSKECTELLLQHGADPDLTDDRGNTALHRIRTSHVCMLLLLEAGADLNLRNHAGRTPLDEASSRHLRFYNGRMVRLLLAWGARCTTVQISEPVDVETAVAVGSNQFIRVVEIENIPTATMREIMWHSPSLRHIFVRGGGVLPRSTTPPLTLTVADKVRMLDTDGSWEVERLHGRFVDLRKGAESRRRVPVGWITLAGPARLAWDVFNREASGGAERLFTGYNESVAAMRHTVEQFLF